MLKKITAVVTVSALTAVLMAGCVDYGDGTATDNSSSAMLPAAFSLAADTSISTNSSDLASEDAAEAQLKMLLQKSMPSDMIFFDYDDFDSDGNFEAFAVCSSMKVDDINGNIVNYDSCQLWYSDKNGARILEDNLYGYPSDTVTAGNAKFIVWEMSAGGSGSLSVIYGVRDGKPYQPAISRKYEWFCFSDGKYQAETNDFSLGYHTYDTHYFSYDESSREFIEIND